MTKKATRDAVEKSIGIVEADPSITSVGLGGYPDRDGHVTLDACIMDQNGNAGSVLFLENIVHPISVARKVMEKTPHVMLSGDGAFTGNAKAGEVIAQAANAASAIDQAATAVEAGPGSVSTAAKVRWTMAMS